MPVPKKLQVFLCHASLDKPKVSELYRYLRRRGIAPWLDAEDLVPGQHWEVEIPKALLASDVIIVCLSSNSITKEGYVQKEIAFALDKAKEKPEETIFIIPAKLEECEVPARLSGYHWVDLHRPGGYQRLMRGLKLRAEQRQRSGVKVDDAQAEAEKLAEQKAEQERLAREKADAERVAAEKAEAERIAGEEAEKERLAILHAGKPKNAEMLPAPAPSVPGMDARASWDVETDPSAGPHYFEKRVQARIRRAQLSGWILFFTFVLGIIVGGIAVVWSWRSITNMPTMTPTKRTATAPIRTLTTNRPVTPTVTLLPLAVGSCEYIVKWSDNFYKYQQDWGINSANISCETKDYYCSNGKLMHGLQPGIILIFPNIDPDFCRNTIGGISIPAP